MKRTLCVCLVLCLWVESIFSVDGGWRKQVYHVEGAPQFAHYYNLSDGKIRPETPLQFYEWYYAALTLGFTLIGNVIVPPGIALGGIADIVASSINLLQKIDGLNKLAQECSFEKSLVLDPYLKKDGRELLLYYLSSKQAVIHHAPIKILNNDGGRIHSGVNPFQLRDLTDNFIQKYQLKGLTLNPGLNKAIGEEYEKDLDTFVRSMGFVVFSYKTLIHLQKQFQGDQHKSLYETEKWLYQKLAFWRILTAEGSLKSHRMMNSFTVNTASIISVLKKIGIHNVKLQTHILHDLGFVAPRDLEIFNNKIGPTLFEDQHFLQHLSAHTRNRLQERKHIFEEQLKRLMKGYFRKESKLKVTIEDIFLSTLTSSKELKQYKVKYHVDSVSGFNDDTRTLKKLAYLESVDQRKSHDYNFYDLESESLYIYKFLISFFHKREIQNENFQILCVRGEDIAITALTHLDGIGLFTFGALETALPILVSFISPAIYGILDMIGLGGLGVAGIPYTIVHAITLAQSIKSLISLQTSMKVSALLVAHLESRDFSTLSDAEIKYLSIKRFQVMGQNYIFKLKEEMFLTRIGLEASMTGLGVCYMILGLHVLLAVIGIGFFASTLFASSFLLVPFVYFATTAPLALLAFHDLRLQKEILFAERALDFYSSLFDKNSNSNSISNSESKLTSKQDDFLKLFFNNTKMMMRIGIHSMRLRQEQHEMTLSTSLDDIDTNIVNAYTARRRAIRNLKKMMKQSVVAHALVEKMVQEHLLLNHPGAFEAKNFVEDLRPSYYVNHIDIIIGALTPGLTDADKVEALRFEDLPPSTNDFFRELHLGRIFTFANAIYNNYRKNRYEEQFLFHKQVLQYRYFNQSITDKERNHLLMNIKRRHESNRELYLIAEFDKEQSDLGELHPDLSTFPGSSPWDDSFFKQLNELHKFDKKQVIKAHTRTISQLTMKIEMPVEDRLNDINMSSFKRFMQLFIPL